MAYNEIRFINTDEKHSPGSASRMIAAGVAGVWGDNGKQRKKFEASKPEAGDVIYAYQSGVGAIARGVIEDGRIYQASMPDPVFPECKDGDDWHMKVRWTRLPDGRAAVTPAETIAAVGVQMSSPQSYYRKTQRPLIRYLDRQWGIVRQLPRHWGILCHPDTYDVQAAAAALPEDTWNLPVGDPEPGDLLVFWKAKGRSDERGVVALGEVLAGPAIIPSNPKSGAFWPAAMPSDEQRRIWLRYVTRPAGPLWLHDDRDAVLADLSVAKAQGNKLYTVTPEQWDRLVVAFGGWPEGSLKPTADPEELERRVQQLLRFGQATKPAGSVSPAKITSESTTAFVRDPGVKAWVLRRAAGTCECCRQPGPFETDHGYRFLEVHHVRRLADGGSDTVENAVGICPNCHRELHHGKGRVRLVEDLYRKVLELVRQ